MTQTYDFDKSTFENHREHLTVPWADPKLLPRMQTTSDEINERLTIEAPRTTVGDTQENS
jgi:hypothetical protein